MSLRAIKKRESQQQNFCQKPPSTLYKKSTQVARKFNSNTTNSASTTHSSLSSVQNLEQQRLLLGRTTRSNPELRKPTDTLELLAAKNARLVRTKSESDVTALLKTFSGVNASSGVLNSAKSEICLETISVHTTIGYPVNSSEIRGSSNNKQLENVSNKMISGARSHRDLSQSSYGAASTAGDNLPRRMSECSLNSSASAYSERTSAMSSSALTLMHDGDASHQRGLATAAVRVPIIGYEVMEERARFTVYKLRVENHFSNDCWLVLRRYTDFVRLNTKLKQAFPHITLLLPRKKIFGDNFNSVFLDNRVQGLQLFVNSIMGKVELRRCKMVREFFCLDEPPTYSESMEECRAIFEAQEETIAHLKMQITSKNDLILNLQQKLREEMLEKEQLKEAMKNLSINCPNCSTLNTSTSLK